MRNMWTILPATRLAMTRFGAICSAPKNRLKRFSSTRTEANLRAATARLKEILLAVCG